MASKDDILKETFESEWHILLFDIGPVFKDDQGLIIDITQGTEIK